MNLQEVLQTAQPFQIYKATLGFKQWRVIYTKEGLRYFNSTDRNSLVESPAPFINGCSGFIGRHVEMSLDTIFAQYYKI